MSVTIARVSDGPPIPDVDPHCRATSLVAEAAAVGAEAVTLEIAVRDVAVAYPLLLTDIAGIGVLARTVEYGGPFLRCGAVDAHIWPAARALLDDALPRLGVISEVFMLAAGLPDRDAVAHAWGATAGKEIRVVDPAAVAAGTGLRKGRRSDLARARRELTVAARPLDARGALTFATRYAEAMQAKGATDRWRRGPGFFRALADGTTLLVEAGDRAAGAAAIFLVAGPRASYAFSARWGAPGPAASAVLAEGCRVLAAAGVSDVVLGGGVTDAPDDSLLDFKRSWGGAGVPFLIGARVYDAGAHRRAVVAGRARPLPATAVPA